MSKRTTIFLSLLALITALLSVLFISISFLVDFLAGNETASLVFKEIRTAFDLIAEYTAFGIVIYSFCRYTPSKAKRSILIALGSILLSFIFQLTATAIFELTTSAEKTGDIWGNILMFSLFGLFGVVIERILPCLLIAFITFLCTRNGTTKISGIFSLKNPIQKSMFFSAITIYLVNAIPTLSLHIIEIIGIGGTSQMYAEEFMLNYVIPHILILVYNLILVYFVFLITYFICKKFEESAPIKRKNTSPLEEK